MEKGSLGDWRGERAPGLAGPGLALNDLSLCGGVGGSGGETNRRGEAAEAVEPTLGLGLTGPGVKGEAGSGMVLLHIGRPGAAAAVAATVVAGGGGGGGGGSASAAADSTNEEASGRRWAARPRRHH